MDEKDRLQMIIDRAARFLRMIDRQQAERWVCCARMFRTDGMDEATHIREIIAHTLAILEVEK